MFLIGWRVSGWLASFRLVCMFPIDLRVSKRETMLSGVAQGSVLGALLFSICLKRRLLLLPRV